MEHVDAGRTLDSCPAYIAGESQEPACQRRTDSAAELRSERCAGVHGAVHPLAVCEVSVLGTCRDQSVHIALKRAHSDGRDGCTGEHQRDGAEVTGNDDTKSAEGADRIAGKIQTVHSAPFCDKGRSEQKTDDHRNVDSPGEDAEKVSVLQYVGHIVNAHVERRRINLHQDIGSADHQVIFILNKEFESVNQVVLFFFSRSFYFDFVIHQLLRRQFLDRKYRERVRYNAHDGVNDRNGTPCSGSASEIGDQTDSDRLDQHTGAESEHKADGAHLYALVIIFCDERCQSGIRDVVGCVEACVKKRVGDKEPCILSCRSEIRRYAENGDEAERAAEVAIEHPGTCFSHLCLGLVDQRTEENIAHTVKEL